LKPIAISNSRTNLTYNKWHDPEKVYVDRGNLAPLAETLTRRAKAVKKVGVGRV